MFNKKKPENTEKKLKIETTIGEMAKVEGNFNSDSDTRINGSVEGEIEIHGKLFIGESSKIKATIVAEELIVAGEVEGNVDIDYNVNILASGKLVGDILLGGDLIIEPGAIFIGSSKMQDKIDEDLDTEDFEDINDDDLDID